MALTAEQIEDRRKGIGASDVAAILGLSPWATATDIYWTKTAGTAFSGNAATDMGNTLEPAILARAEAELGPLARDVVVQHPTLEFCRSRLDGQLLDTLQPVEAKTAGIVNYMPREIREQWGEDDTDEVPMGYLVQVQFQIACTGADLAYLYALLGGRGFARFRIIRNDRLIAGMMSKVEAFWASVLAGTPPDPSAPVPMEILKTVRREPTIRATVPVDIVRDWDAAKAALKEATEAEKTAKARLLESLGEAEIGDVDDGRVVKFMEQRVGGSRIDAAALKTSWPDIYKQVEKPAAMTRVLRVTGKPTSEEID